MGSIAWDQSHGIMQRPASGWIRDGHISHWEDSTTISVTPSLRDSVSRECARKLQ